MCVTMLPSFDEVMYLMDYKEKTYPLIKLNSRNAVAFENRCLEINVCEKIFGYITDNLLADPEDALYEYRLFLENEKEYFKNNRKRSKLIDQKIEIIDDLYKELKKFRGEPM